MQSQNSNSLVFLVSGMHRSGTSALTRVLNLVGLTAPNDVLAPNKYNKSGYWESTQILQFNDQLLKNLDRHWADPKPLPTGWEIGEDIQILTDQAAKLLESEFEQTDGIVVKDPRLSRVMPLWRSAVEKCGSEAICLIAYRNPLNVYQSLNTRNGMDFEHAMHLWLSYMLEVEAGSRGLSRAFVSYDALLTHWNSTLRSAFAAAGLPDLMDFEKHRAAIDGFIDQNQRHHSALDIELFHHPEVDQQVKSVYELFMQHDSVENLHEFQHLHKRWLTDWDLISPGPKGSEFAKRLPVWHYEQSVSFKKMGHIEDAISATQKAIELAPKQAQFHHVLGNLLANVGKLEEAEAAQRQAILLKNDVPKFHVGLSHVLNQLHRIDEAIIAVRDALELDPKQAQFHHVLGSLLTNVGKLAEAEAAQRQAILLKNDVPQFHVALSHVLNRLGRTSEAIKAVGDAIERDPKQAPFYHHLGNLLATSGKLEEAEAAQRQAILLKNDVPKFHVGLSHVLNQLHRIDEAIIAVRDAIERDPKLAQSHHHLGNLLATSGKLEEAEAAQRQAILLENDTPRFHVGLSQVLNRLGRTSEAIAAIGDAIERDPKQAQFHHVLGSLLTNVGKLAEAEAAQRQAILLKNDVPQFHVALSHVLNQLHRIDEAIIAVRDALELDPKQAPFYRHLGNLLAKIGKPEEAIEVINSALEVYPDHILLRLSLGNLFAEVGRYDKAEAEQQRVSTIGCQKFDFRWTTEQEGYFLSKARQQASVEELIPILAFHGSNWWVKTLRQSVQYSETKPDNGEAEWPLGSVTPTLKIPTVKRQKKMRSRPKLSIMIPVYNVKREDWLIECIESILDQDKGPEWAEIIIIDDASNNKTAKSVAERYSERVIYRRNSKNLGILANHNRCIEISSGEFVHILHQDDRVEPGFYDTILDTLMADDKLVAGFTRAIVIDSNGDRIFFSRIDKKQAGIYDNLLQKMTLRLHLLFPAIIVRHSAYETVGGFSPSLYFAFDWEMWGRLAASGKIWYDPKPLVSYRIHEGSTTKSIAAMDRSIDRFRCIAYMLPRLPASSRWKIGRQAILQQTLFSWSEARGTKLGMQEQKELVDFLLRDWATSDEKVKIHAALRRSRA